MTVRELIQRFVEQGLRQPSVSSAQDRGRRQPPPVIILPTGTPIAAISWPEVRRLEEQEDEQKHARSVGG